MTDYEVRTTTGTPILTTPHRELALEHAKAKAPAFGCLDVVKVIRYERREAVQRFGEDWREGATA